MPNIFNYFDYREYLDAFYNEKKSANASFSFQVFADKCGFRSKSFLKMVIAGSKNLSEPSTKKLNRVLKLGEKSFAYFCDLVAFGQTEDLTVRNMYFERLMNYNPRNPFRVVAREQYEFYAEWYHNTIRELVTMVNFGEDYERLGRMVKPPISAYNARRSVTMLLRLGLIKKTKDGYESSDPIITTGNEVPTIHGDALSLAVHNFHQQNLALAAESIGTCSRRHREISSLIIALNREGFDWYKKQIQEFQEKLLRYVESRQTKKPDRVYHCNFQLFPTSEETKEGNDV